MHFTPTGHSRLAVWQTRMTGASRYWTSRAALRMKEATTYGWDNIATWLDGSVIDVAFMRSANIACSVGETTRSYAAITNQLGLFRQAGVEITPVKEAMDVGPWVAVSTVCSDSDRSGAKSSRIPVGVSFRNPKASCCRC